MARTKGRVVKPRNTKEGLELAAKVYSKHLNDGNTSDLHALDGYSWDITGPEISKALAYHHRAEELRAEMEAQYQLRDLAFGTIQSITNASAAFLKGKYSKNPKKLGEWGYNVDDSAPVKKVRTEKMS
jgi:hypothetical protein